MKGLLLKGLSFHFICLAIFTLIYVAIYDECFINTLQHYDKNLPKNEKFVDCFYFSTTVQAGVGLTSLKPTNAKGKLIVSLQEILMIVANILILIWSIY
tara:strand:- start:613 stop:909 length:297 start_codon:yes stop_codon:yes gene_type:complete